MGPVLHQVIHPLGHVLIHELEEHAWPTIGGLLAGFLLVFPNDLQGCTNYLVYHNALAKYGGSFSPASTCNNYIGFSWITGLSVSAEGLLVIIILAIMVCGLVGAGIAHLVQGEH